MFVCFILITSAVLETLVCLVVATVWELFQKFPASLGIFGYELKSLQQLKDTFIYIVIDADDVILTLIDYEI